MKHIFLNLKRFDISPEKGGVNRLAPMQNWGAAIVSGTQEALAAYDPSEVEFVMYMPEAHLLGAAAAKKAGSPVRLGSQGVYRADTAVGGNFGAFTTNRPANAVAQMGCAGTLIGHCEERNDKMGILAEAGVTGKAAAEAVNRILNQEIKCAQAAGLTVLTFMTGPLPNRPPNSSSSPTVLPIAGMTRTAVVLELTMPMAASSAMIPEITSEEVSPGIAIISRPTEQTAVIASSLVRLRAPVRAA